MHLDAVLEVLNAILLYEPVNDRAPEIEIYFLHEIVKQIDSHLPYSDEWGKSASDYMKKVFWMKGMNRWICFVFIIHRFYLKDLRRM